jgi:hypothetical protein
MRRLARHLFTLCAMLSAILGGIVLVAWRTAPPLDDNVTPPLEDIEHQLTRVGCLQMFVDRHSVGIGVVTPWQGRPTAVSVLPFDGQFFIPRPPYGFVRWNTRDLSASSFMWTSEFQYRALLLPPWLVVAITGLLPSWWLLRAIRVRGRRLRGLCASCGYDLRASPDRCPECGTPAAQVS